MCHQARTRKLNTLLPLRRHRALQVISFHTAGPKRTPPTIGRGGRSVGYAPESRPPRVKACVIKCERLGFIFMSSRLRAAFDFTSQQHRDTVPRRVTSTQFILMHSNAHRAPPEHLVFRDKDGGSARTHSHFEARNPCADCNNNIIQSATAVDGYSEV